MGELHRHGQSQPANGAIHHKAYLEFRKSINLLLAEAFSAKERAVGADECRLMAIGINAVIDRIWLEASLDPGLFAPGELLAIRLKAMEWSRGLPLGDEREQQPRE